MTRTALELCTTCRPSDSALLSAEIRLRVDERGTKRDAPVCNDLYGCLALAFSST